MNGTGRIHRSTKQSLLESIYDTNLKEYYYSSLDLLICKRYLIKEKVREMKNLLDVNEINFRKTIEGMSVFRDIEQKFYEGT